MQIYWKIALKSVSPQEPLKANSAQALNIEICLTTITFELDHRAEKLVLRLCIGMLYQALRRDLAVKRIRQSVILEIIEARHDKEFQQTTHTFERLFLYLAPPWRTPPTVLIPFPKWKL